MENAVTIHEPNGDALLAMIERVASNPQADITKMQALLDMRNKELERVKFEQKEAKEEARKEAFSRDYVLMKPNLPLIAKRKENKQTHSRYAALEDINKEIDPILAKHGFATATNVLSQKDGLIIVEATLLHRDGYSQSCRVEVPLDNAGAKGTINKTDIHATASSITYGKRIAICALLNVSTGDDKDGNVESTDLATISQRQVVSTLFQKLKPEHQEMFIKDFGAIAEVMKSDVDRAMATLNNTIKGYGEKK